jgi:hypothetical protein
LQRACPQDCGWDGGGGAVGGGRGGAAIEGAQLHAPNLAVDSGLAKDISTCTQI